EAANLPMLVLEEAQVGAQTRITLAPVSWKSAENWQITVPYEEAQKLKVHQGQLLYVLPRQGHVFANGAQKPSFVTFAERTKASEGLRPCRDAGAERLSISRRELRFHREVNWRKPRQFLPWQSGRLNLNHCCGNSPRGCFQCGLAIGQGLFWQHLPLKYAARCPPCGG